MLDYSKLKDPWVDDLEARDKAQAKIAASEIKKRQELLASKEKEIQQLKYEANLIEGDICSVIRNDFSEVARINLFYGLQINLLHQAWKYFNHAKGESPSDEKEEKRIFEFVDDRMRKTFFPFDENAKLVELSSIQGREAYAFVYECLGNKIHVTVPIFAHASEENYRSMLKGYIAYYEESELSIVEFASSLEYAELAKEIEAFAKKKKEGKE